MLSRPELHSPILGRMSSTQIHRVESTAGPKIPRSTLSPTLPTQKPQPGRWINATAFSPLSPPGISDLKDITLWDALGGDVEKFGVVVDFFCRTSILALAFAVRSGVLLDFFLDNSFKNIQNFIRAFIHRRFLSEADLTTSFSCSAELVVEPADPDEYVVDWIIDSKTEPIDESVFDVSSFFPYAHQMQQHSVTFVSLNSYQIAIS